MAKYRADSDLSAGEHGNILKISLGEVFLLQSAWRGLAVRARVDYRRCLQVILDIVHDGIFQGHWLFVVTGLAQLGNIGLSKILVLIAD